MTAPTPALPRLTPVADHALLVEFAEAIDDAAHEVVLHLDRVLSAHPPAGVAELVPAYVSLLVDFDPLATNHAAVAAAVMAALREPRAGAAAGALREVLVCYDADLAPDLAEVAARTGLSEEAVIKAHLAGDYRVFMYGFAPGWCYLGGLPKELGISRRATPRPPIPPNTIIVAGGLSLVATNSMPTGWWLIGRTAERMMTLGREPVFLAEPGDYLRFERVDRATFNALDARAAAGELVARKETPP